MIIYPVRAAGDGTERIIDAAGQVLGTVEIVDALNHGHQHGHAGELGAGQVDLIRRLEDRVSEIERQLREVGRPWTEWRQP